KRDLFDHDRERVVGVARDGLRRLAEDAVERPARGLEARASSFSRLASTSTSFEANDELTVRRRGFPSIITQTAYLPFDCG
ncbi:MAG: hypothetical protein WKF65_16135, partial [Gaiellaceae bacterium]